MAVFGSAQSTTAGSTGSIFIFSSALSRLFSTWPQYKYQCSLGLLFDNSTLIFSTLFSAQRLHIFNEAYFQP
jgi:hypothetical protein